MKFAVFVVHRLIQEEKETTEQRAEELESRVGSHTNLEAMAGGPSARAAAGWQRDRSFERTSPPVSGRSTPTPITPRGYATAPRDFLHKYNTVSDMWGPGACAQPTKHLPACLPQPRGRLDQRKLLSSFSLSY